MNAEEQIRQKTTRGDGTVGMSPAEYAHWKFNASSVGQKLALVKLRQCGRRRFEGIITIPDDLRARPLEAVRMSARLRHILGRGNFKTLGDLHGLIYLEMLSWWNCGVFAVEELKSIVTRIHQPARPRRNRPRAHGAVDDYEI